MHVPFGCALPSATRQGHVEPGIQQVEGRGRGLRGLQGLPKVCQVLVGLGDGGLFLLILLIILLVVLLDIFVVVFLLFQLLEDSFLVLAQIFRQVLWHELFRVQVYTLRLYVHQGCIYICNGRFLFSQLRLSPLWLEVV